MTHPHKPEKVTAPVTAFARPFKVTHPNGYTVNGVQFPSGRCVLDDDHGGLVAAATTFDELPLLLDPAWVKWADRGNAEGPPVRIEHRWRGGSFSYMACNRCSRRLDDCTCTPGSTPHADGQVIP